MKRVLFILFLFVASYTQAQFNENSFKLKFGSGYVQDFPGLGGYGITGELSLPMTHWLEGAIGAKWMNMQGYPRTTSVKEHTRTATIDFNLFFLPINTDVHIVRLGAGYSFAFYNIRRSYPVTSHSGTGNQTSWPVQDNKGKTSGVSLIGEYEYLFANSNMSLGLRAAWYKAYDQVSYVGPFVGLRL
jgi:hypothetical protein